MNEGKSKIKKNPECDLETPPLGIVLFHQCQGKQRQLSSYLGASVHANYLIVLSYDEKSNLYIPTNFIQQHNLLPQTNDKEIQCGLYNFEFRKHSKGNDIKKSTTMHNRFVLIGFGRICVEYVIYIFYSCHRCIQMEKSK